MAKSTGKALGSPGPRPPLPPPLSWRSFLQPWALPHALSSRPVTPPSQVGGCLPNPARAPNTSSCCVQSCAHRHTDNTHKHQNTQAAWQGGEAHSEIQVNTRTNTCAGAHLFIVGLFIFCLNHPAQKSLKAERGLLGVSGAPGHLSQCLAQCIVGAQQNFTG